MELLCVRIWGSDRFPHTETILSTKTPEGYFRPPFLGVLHLVFGFGPRARSHSLADGASEGGLPLLWGGGLLTEFHPGVRLLVVPPSLAPLRLGRLHEALPSPPALCLVIGAFARIRAFEWFQPSQLRGHRCRTRSRFLPDNRQARSRFLPANRPARSHILSEEPVRMVAPIGWAREANQAAGLQHPQKRFDFIRDSVEHLLETNRRKRPL